ncbi:hypothetical protein ACLMJK_008344 [Lecanora helva]
MAVALNTNDTIKISRSSSSALLPSAITVSTETSSSSLACEPCLIFASEGGANILSKVIWYETPVPVTLDTVSVVVSIFKDITITGSSTVYGDIQKLNGSQVPAEASLRYVFSHAGQNNPLMQLNNYYASMGPFVLANGTDGAVGGGTTPTSFAYPTPYLGINGFILFTSLSKGASSGQCLVSSAREGVVQGVELQVEGLGSTTIVFGSTFYSPIPGMAVTGTEISSVFQNFYENVGIDTSSFSAFLLANTALVGSFPMLASCLYQSYGFGPPAVKIPVSALTATTTTTTRISDSPSTSAAPGSPITPLIAPSTPLPKPPPVQTKASVMSASPSSLAIQSQNLPQQDSPDLPLGDQKPATQESGQPDPTHRSYPFSKAQQWQATQPNLYGAAPVITYASREIYPDQSSRYDLPGIGVLQPGGFPVTFQDVVYSLAPSASAINSNGRNIPIAVVRGPSKPLSGPRKLAFLGSVYTAGPSSNIVIGSQTLVPGGSAITLLSTPIVLASDGTIAVIGTDTTTLKQADSPTEVPVLSFGDATYPAISSSAFFIAGQSLTPGGSITISGTPLAYPIDANVVVVGTSTQPLSLASITTFPSLILTFGGNVYTADSDLEFDIGSQTLTRGGIITISGTPISFASGGGDVVVGSTTETLVRTNTDLLGGGTEQDGSNDKPSNRGAKNLQGSQWLIFCAMTVGGLLLV